MSLINDALKRVQQAQPKRTPEQAPDRPLQPATLPETRSKTAYFCVALVALASLAAGFCMKSWSWRSGAETVRMAGTSPAAPRPVLTPVAAQSSAGALPKGTVVPADAFVSTVVKESAPPEPELKKAATPPPTTPAPAEKAGAGRTDASELGIYIVRTGDTLTRIAKRHGTSVKALRAVNAFKGDRIAVGQKIRVPAAPATRATAES